MVLLFIIIFNNPFQNKCFAHFPYKMLRIFIYIIFSPFEYLSSFLLCSSCRKEIVFVFYVFSWKEWINIVYKKTESITSSLFENKLIHKFKMPYSYLCMVSHIIYILSSSHENAILFIYFIILIMFFTLNIIHILA